MTVVDLRSPDAFKELYREQLGYVYSVLRRLGGPAESLEDLCHDVFMTAFRKRADYDGSRPIKPWLFGIAFRLMLNVKRKATVECDDQPLVALEDTRANPEQVLAQRQAQTALQRAISRLEPDRRAVFLMHDLDGHAAPDIARELEIPLNTAYSRLRLARADILKQTEGLRSGGPSLLCQLSQHARRSRSRSCGPRCRLRRRRPRSIANVSFWRRPAPRSLVRWRPQRSRASNSTLANFLRAF